jgi:hypothetical protein
MYFAFLKHSPTAAHLGHISLSSEHGKSVITSGGLSNDRTWIHFVADHFSPSTTGQLAWRLLGSVVALTWRLKNSSASPFLGFTAKEQETIVLGYAYIVKFRSMKWKTLLLTCKRLKATC